MIRCDALLYAMRGDGSPAAAKQSDFPVTPGAAMPAVPGATKRDYSVIFVTAIEPGVPN